MSHTAIDQLSADEVLGILKQAVLVNAEDVRFTAYQPADEVGVRYKLPMSDGRPRFVQGVLESYLNGSRLVRALLRYLCGVPEEMDLESEPPIAVDLLPQWADRLGIKGARVVNSPMKGAGAVGYICILTFEYHARDKEACSRQPDFISFAREA